MNKPHQTRHDELLSGPSDQADALTDPSGLVARQTDEAEAELFEPTAGPECPGCGCRHLPVGHTRRREKMIVRIRTCRACGRRVVTRERAE